MKEKILAELNKKYLGLSKKVLGLIADKLAATVTEESAIEGAISELEKLPISVKDYADLLQKDGDERVTVAQKKWAAENPKKPTDPKPDPADESDPVKIQLAEIKQRLAELDQKEKRSGLTEKLTKALIEKKIPSYLSKGRIPESDEQLETVVTEIETDWLEMKKELANQGFVDSGKPLAGAGGDVSKKAVESDIKSWAAKNQPQAAAKT